MRQFHVSPTTDTDTDTCDFFARRPRRVHRVAFETVVARIVKCAPPSALLATKTRVSNRDADAAAHIAVAVDGGEVAATLKTERARDMFDAYDIDGACARFRASSSCSSSPTHVASCACLYPREPPLSIVMCHVSIVNGHVTRRRKRGVG